MAKIGYPVPQEGRASDRTGTGVFVDFDTGADVNTCSRLSNRPQTGRRATHGQRGGRRVLAQFLSGFCASHCL